MPSTSWPLVNCRGDGGLSDGQCLGSVPDGLRGIDDQLQFCPLIRLGDGIACNGGGKAALRADRELIEIDILRCLADASLEDLDTLKNRGLAADKAQHHALVFDKTEWLEVASSLGVVFKQEMVCLLYTSPSPRDGLLSRMPSSA